MAASVAQRWLASRLMIAAMPAFRGRVRRCAPPAANNSGRRWASCCCRVGRHEGFRVDRRAGRGSARASHSSGTGANWVGRRFLRSTRTTAGVELVLVAVLAGGESTADAATMLAPWASLAHVS